MGFRHFIATPVNSPIWTNCTAKGQRLRDVDMYMCIFTLNWLTLTPKTHFIQFYLKVASYFLSWGKNENVTLGMRLLWKYIRKSKLVIPKIGTFSAITEIVLWIWSWNFGVIMRKIQVFIWHQKRYYFQMGPGNENAMGTYHLNTPFLS